MLKGLKLVLLFCIFFLINENVYANCSCWKVTGWQQNPTQNILGNVPILTPAKCHQNYSNRVWVQVSINNNTSNTYWLSFSMQDPYISVQINPISYKFTPLLLLDTPHQNNIPPQIHTDAIVGSANEIPAQTNCPCPAPYCISEITNINANDNIQVNPSIGAPVPIGNGVISPVFDKRPLSVD